MAVDKVIIEYQLKTDQLRKELDEVKRQLGLIDDSARKTDKELDKINTTGSKISDTFEQMGRGIVAAFAVERLVNFGKEVVQLGIKMESLNVQLKFITGGSVGAGDSMEYLRRMAQKYGMELISLTEAYTKFLGAATKSGVSVVKAQRIFENVTMAARAMNLSVEDTNGVFLALQQMMSKGTVQAEELRGQLGERLPGAFSIAAKAIGVTERELNKMLEQGQVISSEFLPAFTEQLRLTFEEGMVEAANSTAANTARMMNSFTELKLQLSTVLTPAWNAFTQTMTAFFSTGGFASIGATVEKMKADSEAFKKSNDGIIQAFEASGQTVEEYLANFLDYTIALESGSAAELEYNKRFNEKYNTYRKVIDVLAEYTLAIEASEKELTAEEKAALKAAAALKKAEERKKAAEVAKMFADALKRIPEALDELPAAIKEWEKFIDAVTADTPKATAEFEKMTDALEKESDIINELTLSGAMLDPVVQNWVKSYRDGLVTVEQLTDAMQEYIDVEAKATEAADIFAARTQANFDIASSAIQGWSAISDQQTDKYIANLQAQLDAGQITTQEFDRLQTERLRANARAQKAAATFDIILSTAQAIMNALTSKPPEGAAARAIAAGVTGAIQLGVALNAPLPAFAEGVVDLKGKGTETSDDILARLSRGESVITARGTRQDKGLFEAANKMQLDEYINKNYVLPVLLKKQSEQQSAFDDYRLWLATMSNGKKMEKGNKEIVKAIKQTGFNQRRYWA